MIVRKKTPSRKKGTFLNTLEQERSQKSMIGFNRKVERKVDVAEFKEELWDIVVEFGEPFLMGTGLDKEAREELLIKMIHTREPRPSTEPKSC